MAAVDASPDFAQIDQEIANLKAQVAHYRWRRSLLSSTLLSRCSNERVASQPRHRELADRIRKQHRQNVENAYRIGAGITAFRVRDPDPHAVDGGRVLGIRIEVFDCAAQTFDAPHYVFLHRPDGEGGAMKVHKHTVPPYVGLRDITNRYMQYPPRGDEEWARQQDIVRFARALRQALVSATKRRNAVKRLRGDAKGTAGLESVTEKDLNARELELRWEDGSIGRVTLTTAGGVERAYVAAASGGVARRRLRRQERAIEGGDGRIEGIVQRLNDLARDGDLFDGDSSLTH